ncbi:hypothetical protein Adt_42083 [Abeliophyllum distichum]|uniref:Uncharacterized protein n=1 Tax=Abeliophyllum distichum TaxID=126358 RepID=A0ABD1PQP9_9LAMI
MALRRKWPLFISPKSLFICNPFSFSLGTIDRRGGVEQAPGWLLVEVHSQLVQPQKMAKVGEMVEVEEMMEVGEVWTEVERPPIPPEVEEVVRLLPYPWSK